ncbi:MAG: 50S ribosomal protein L30 [Deltaproteobacteria bacterium]|nr:50S ribosomal protein L30 [Deltaproteobacteria bacterium]
MARKQADSPADGGKKMIRIKQIKSGIGYSYRQKRVLVGLGLAKMGRTVIREDTPSIRGMCTKIAHLVEVEEVEG